MDNRMTISSCNKIINEVEAKRKDLLTEIGILVYEKIRKGEITNSKLCEICKPITGFDYTIYNNKKRIQEMTNNGSAFICDCGARLSQEDKFCSGCGNKVEIQVEVVEYINCSNCEMEIPNDSNFCPACGYKIELDFSTFDI